MAQKTITNSEAGSSVRTKLNAVLSYGIAFSDWDATGVDNLPVDSDNVGSGDGGDILKGDRIYFTSGGTINGEFWPDGTIGTALQNSPTTSAHWRLY